MAVAAFAQSRAGHGEMSAMNITPLVDVMLVLLIIFMVQAVPAAQEIDLKLPQPVDRWDEPPPRTVLTLNAEGRLLLEGIAVPMAELRSELAALKRRSPRTVLALDASDAADYQMFARALAEARNAGFADVAIR